MGKILFLFPNTSNDGVISNAITILSAIAKKEGHEARYFETSFYHKKATAAEDRTNSGEFKEVHQDRIYKELKSYTAIFDDFNNILQEYQPDILAVSANSLEYDMFLEIIDKVKWPHNRPFILVGGVHATFCPEDVIRNQYVDAICIGEGEEAFKEFLINYFNKKDLSQIKNIWVKQDKKIYKNELRPLIAADQLWSYEKDFSFYNSEEYYLKPFEGELYKKAFVESSRGCPYNCNYCVNTALKKLYEGKGIFVRFKHLEVLKNEILQKMHQGFNLIQFLDENFLNISLADLKSFCSWYKENIKLPIILQSRAESITEEKIQALHDIGVHIEMSCGVETGSEQILHTLCNRTTTKEQTLRAFNLMEKYGIYSRAYVMIGFPGETRENVFETINFIRQLNPYLSIMSVFYPFVGVPLREYCIKCGFIDGHENARTFTEESVLKNQPMSTKEVFNLRRVYNLYVTMPREYFPDIEDCERNFSNTKFKHLVDLSWKFREKWPDSHLD